MFDSLDRGLRAWIAELADTLTDVIDAVRPPLAVVARRGETGEWSFAPEDPVSAQTHGIAVIRADDPVLWPESSRGWLTGADIAIDLPPDWVFRRTLDPVPAKSAAFLDVFVRHQIDRVTPWREADTWHTVISTPLPSDPSKISVEILVVARSLLATVVPPSLEMRPHRLRLRVGGTDTRPPASIDIPLARGRDARTRDVRRAVGGTVAAIVLLLLAGFGGANWSQSLLETEMGALDAEISSREAFIASARARLARPVEALALPERLRAQTVPMVDVIETLSAVLPDQVYLSDLTFEADHLRITGTARDFPGLIPLIERSGRFAEVAFFAPTTRLPNQAGDRFFIEMRVRHGPEAAPVHEAAP